MDSAAQLLTEVKQPREASVGGLGHRSLHVEMKDRFGRTSPHFGQSSPSRIPGAGSSVAHGAVSHEVHIGEVLAGRPMLLEVV